MQIEYGVPKYTISEAAKASGFPINTLRSLYQRGHFKIVGGEDKKGRGLAAELTLEDVLCLSVAKVAVDAGVHPRVAFEAGKTFAYMSGGAAGQNTGERLPSHVFAGGFTVLVCHPATGTTKILNTNDGLSFTDLFHDAGFLGRHASVVILLNDVERSVFNALGLNEKR